MNRYTFQGEFLITNVFFTVFAPSREEARKKIEKGEYDFYDNSNKDETIKIIETDIEDKVH